MHALVQLEVARNNSLPTCHMECAHLSSRHLHYTLLPIRRSGNVILFMKVNMA